MSHIHQEDTTMAPATASSKAPRTRRPLSRGLKLASVLALVAVAMVAGSAARAGRGSSVGALERVIASGSVDAIQAELERAEVLVCPACVDVVRPLVDHPDARVRQVAAWWLARRGIKHAVCDEMEARLQGADSTLARNAADVVGEMRMREAMAPLGVALGNGALSSEARVAAAHALGSIGDIAAQPTLVAALGAPEASVRAAALSGLRVLRGFGDGAVVARLLSDADAAVRVEAVYTLGALRARDGVAGLVSLLAGDASESVRKKAAWALGEVGAPASEAGPALEKAAASDASPFVRSLARAALGKLTR